MLQHCCAKILGGSASPKIASLARTDGKIVADSSFEVLRRMGGANNQAATPRCHLRMPVSFRPACSRPRLQQSLLTRLRPAVAGLRRGRPITRNEGITAADAEWGERAVLDWVLASESAAELKSPWL